MTLLLISPLFRGRLLHGQHDLCKNTPWQQVPATPWKTHFLQKIIFPKQKTENQIMLTKKLIINLRKLSGFWECPSDKEGFSYVEPVEVV